MVASMKDSIKEVRKMGNHDKCYCILEMDATNGQTEVGIQVNGKIIKYVGMVKSNSSIFIKENIVGWMADNTKEIGRIIICMAKGLMFGGMEEGIKESTI